jgi:hypothetical protein
MKTTTANYGIVYVLSNLAMPDLVKIGMTNRDNVDARLKELFTTSVPVPFECEFACKVTDCVRVEKALHIAFNPYKIHAQREFFKINPEQVIAILKLLDRTSDITKEITEEINNDLTEVDKAAGEKLKINRRPPLNFKAMGIPPGAKLLYAKDGNSIEVAVCSDRKVLFNGLESSLTAVTQELLGLDYAVQPTSYWTFEGKNLQDIYNDTFTTTE